MPIDSGELMRALSIIANERNVRVTVSQTAKGSMVCAACSFVGGMLLGPVGLAVGSAAGGLAAYKMTSGTFRPLADVLLNDMSDTQKEMLVRHVTNAVQNLHPTDAALLIPLILNDASIKQAVFNTVLSFVRNDLQLQIVD